MDKVIFIDMDGVVVRWKENDISIVSKPGFFLGLTLEPKMKKAILDLVSKGHKVEFLSACITEHAKAEKTAWLQKNGLGHIPRNFCMCWDSKVDVVKDRPETELFLLDDFNKNLRQWSEAQVPGKTFKAIKFLNGINGGTPKTWFGPAVNLQSDDLAGEIIKIVG